MAYIPDPPMRTTGMAPKGFNLGDFVSNFGRKTSNFLESDQAPIVLGDLAQAVMGGSPQGQGSWQSLLGKVASNLGKSRIASKEAQRQEDQKRAWNDAILKLMSGEIDVPVTEAGTPGPTKVTRTVGPGGAIDVKVSGDAPTRRPAGPAAPRAGLQYNRQGVRNLLPFFLASAGNRAQGVDLTGLSPEQINAIVTQRRGADEVRNQTVNSIYGSIQRGALADYYDRLPQDTRDRVKTMVAGKDGNWHAVLNDGTTIDTKIPAPERAMYFGGGRAANRMSVAWNPKTNRYETVMVDPYSGEIVPFTYPGGGQVSGEPQVPEQTKTEFGFFKDRAQAGAYIQENPRGERAIEAMNMMNRTAPDDEIYYYFYDPKLIGKDVSRLKLPKLKDGTQLTMGRVRSDAEEAGITLQEGLQRIFGRNKR